MDSTADTRAHIVKVWSGSYVNLVVFMDGTNDGRDYSGCIRWATSIEYSAEPKPRTWHWIERAPATDAGPPQL